MEIQNIFVFLDWCILRIYCLFLLKTKNTAQIFCECAEKILPLHKILKIVQNKQ